jgi:hypothetical protein
MSEKCNHGCKPINGYYHGRQLVESPYDGGLYPARMPHLPCGLPGCEASKLVRNLPEEKPKSLGATEEFDKIEKEMRERLRRQGYQKATHDPRQDEGYRLMDVPGEMQYADGKISVVQQTENSTASDDDLLFRQFELLKWWGRQ